MKTLSGQKCATWYEKVDGMRKPNLAPIVVTAVIVFRLCATGHAASESVHAGRADLNDVLAGIRQADSVLSEHDARFSYEVETIQYPEGTALAVSYVRGEETQPQEEKLKRYVVRYADAVSKRDRVRFDEQYQLFKGDSEKPVARSRRIWAYDGEMTRTLRVPTSNKQVLRATQSKSLRRPRALPPHQMINEFIGRDVLSISDNLESGYSNMSLDEDTQQIGGNECHVIRAADLDGDAVLTMWVVPEIDYRPVRVERRSSRFHSVLEASFEQVGGIWSLARGTWETWFITSDGDELRVRKSTLTVKSASYTRMQLPDSLFVLEFPEETMTIWDADQGRYVQWPILVGKQALELDVTEWLYGDGTSLESLHGQAIVLALWDSAHESSADVIETLNEVATRHSDVAVCAVHSAGADLEDLRKSITDKSMKYRVAFDKPAHNYKGATFEKYGVTHVPAVFIIDTKGKVRYQDIPLQAVEEAVRQLLDEQ